MQNCKWMKKACGVVGIVPLLGLISVNASAHVALVDGSGLYADYECVRTLDARSKYPMTVRLLSREEDLIPHFLEFSGEVAQLQLMKEKGVKGSITLIPQKKTMIGEFAVLLPNSDPAVAMIIAGPRSDLSKVYSCHSVD